MVRKGKMFTVQYNIKYESVTKAIEATNIDNQILAI